MIRNLKRKPACALAIFLVLLVSLTQVAPSYADTVSSDETNGFVIEDGVLTSYTGTDTEVTIPDTVTEIGANAFKNSKCTSVTIPSSVTKIGSNAFFNAAVTKIDIPSSVETIADNAFYAAKTIEITFHEGLKTIGESAFSEVYFPAGTIIEIPESVTSIGAYGFDCLGISSKGTSSIKIKNKDTVLGNSFIYQKNVKVYGHKDSTAQTYVSDMKESKGDACTLEFIDMNSVTDIPVASISIKPESLSLIAGASQTLSAEISPEDATDKKITWSSENDNIATVNAEGKVTAVAPGSVKIKAVAAAKEAQCNVTVTAPEDFEIQNGVLTAYNGKDTTVTVPSNVTEIAEKAFYGASSIKELTICEGVTKIGIQAFMGMSSLETLNLPASLETVGTDGSWFGELFATVSKTGTPQTAPAALAEINVAEGSKTYSSTDGILYSASGETLIYCPAAKTKIQFNSETVSIAEYAFYKSSITEMSLPDKLESTGRMAFASSNVKYLKLPASMKTIGNETFFNAQLRCIDMNEGLETIGDSAFSVSHVVGVTIPESVKSIGAGAFDYEYSGDKYIVIKGTNTQLGEDAIPYYYALDVYAPSGSNAEEFVSAEKTKYGDKCKMTFYALDEFKKASAVSLSEASLTMNRQETKDLTITTTPENARIPSVVWTSSDVRVASVNDKGQVTAQQPGTAEITARAGALTASCSVSVVKAEGESDFTVDEEGLITGFLGEDMTRLEIPEDVNGTKVAGIKAGAFKEVRTIEEVILPKTLTEIGDNAFFGCTKLKSINLENVTKIGEKSFAGTALESVRLGEGMTFIPTEAFSSCSSLTKVILPDTLEQIGEGAFRSCSSLKRLSLNEGLRTIGKEAFMSVPLSTLHLPSTFENMGEDYMGDVFEVAGKNIADKAMKTITVSGDNPLYSSYNGILYNKEGTKVVFCPRGRTSARVVDGVTEIGDFAFFMCFDLEKVTLPASLRTIGKGAFQYDEGLTDCELPQGLKTVKASAFFGAENWTGVDRIPSSVRSIGPYGFAECKGSKLVIPEGITHIEEFSFWGYEEGLKEIILPSTLKTIDNSAFSWAKDVKRLVIPKGVTSIGKEAFARMDSLQELVLPSTLKEIGERAFMGKEGGNKLKIVSIPSSVKTIADNAFLNRENIVIKADSKDSTAAKFAQSKGYTLTLGSIASKNIRISGTTFVYNGKTKKPAVTITGLKAGTDYTVSYGNNKAIGKATVTITGKGYYTGKVVKTFTIVPAKAALKSVKAGKKSLTVNIRKQSGGVAYQIAYKKAGTKAWKKTNSSKIKKTIKSLKKGKKYTIKVRAYKKVSGKTYYGSWSKTKKVKVK